MRRLGQLHGPLGDVFGEVGHPLQVGVDLERRRDAAQVDRHRLVQRQHLEALLFDLVLLLVDLGVARDHFQGEPDLAALQGPDGLVNRFLDGGGHRQDVALQVVKVPLQVFRHALGPPPLAVSRYPNRPVM